MERYKCRFCFKRFVNGRALGGHMRSHITNLHDNRFNVAEQEQEHPSQLSDETESYPSSSSTSSSSSEEGEITQNEFIKKPKMKNNEDFTYTNSNETEFHQRFKKTRKLDSFESSISDTTTEEDLAFCLMMLSRDDNKWKRKKKIIKGRFKCETCDKVFKSYQALGGHRASHKKNKIYNKIVITEDKKIKKLHQCPICLRVFSSGQALGGHKRSHGINGGLALINQIETVNVNVKMIDLNLPATMEDFQ